jgi:D-alanyl-lipoteichoic acid acyltransferase DltB (MBOAT superfamily)
MAFPSISFAYFFLAVFTGAWFLRGRTTARNAWLLAASYLFYASWHLRLGLWLLALTLLDWLVAQGLFHARSPRLRRVLVTAGVLANVGLLAVLKLYDFLRESLDRVALLLGLQAHLPVLELLAPVGLSFFTFQGIAYLVDAYRGEAARASLLDFALFMAFFPKLLAGPICRSTELLPQLAAPGPAACPDVERAAALVLAGLWKKLVLAGYLSTHLVGDVFQVPERYAWPALVVALFGYTAEIYFDFSGYTDLARGLSLLLGFELPENFRYPYAATSIGDFWRRWHMTFSRWLRDYVYFPLGGSRRRPLRVCLNLGLTMLVCGLWHGASWGFVIWGLLHGCALVIDKIARARRPKQSTSAPAPSVARAFLSGAATLIFCAIARVFFRCEDLATAWSYLSGLVHPGLDFSAVDGGVVAITVGCFALNITGSRLFDGFVRMCRRLPRPVLPVAWAAVGMVLLACKTPEMTPYIYFGF